MADTKENILHTALRLFARDGYEAASVSDIAGELGITKGALYKHYKNKQDIFNSIVERMYQIDAERAKKFEVPEETFDRSPEAYRNTDMDKITAFIEAQFHFLTEDEFARSLAFIRKCGFAEMHIFPYSRRPGTPADKMPGQHGNAVKEARSRAAIAVAEEMSRAYREALVGSVQSVLFEDMEDGLFTGHAPNYVKVYVPGEGLHNQVRRVRITGLYKDGLTGSLEP